MPVTDANDDRPLLQRAIDLAFQITEPDPGPLTLEQLAAGEVSNERLLAHAFLSAMDRLSQIGRFAPGLHRCGWCVAAAGDNEAAWQAVPTMDAAAIRAHTQGCEHNPLVRRVKELEGAIFKLGDALLRGALDAATVAETIALLEKGAVPT